MGGLAYWPDDFPAARIAYEERLTLAEPTGDPVLLADAHYDLGFIVLVEQRPDGLRMHEQRRSSCYTEAGDLESAVRARQALVLGMFLSGDYDAASMLSRIDLEIFRDARFGAPDRRHPHAAGRLGVAGRRPRRRLGSPQASRQPFAARGSASGLARVLGMAAIILISESDPELGARFAGATYRLVHEKGVMLAPVRVLHLPDPAELARDRLGEARADQLMAEGDAMPLEDAVALLAATAAPAPRR